MKKLKLQPEDLTVGSFVTDPRAGEVHGMQMTPRCTAELELAIAGELDERSIGASDLARSVRARHIDEQQPIVDEQQHRVHA